MMDQSGKVVFKAFSFSPRKLVAFAELDATVTQSGEFEAAYNVMSKRGSPYLRKAIFQAALVAAFKDPVLSAYYQKKSKAKPTENHGK